MRHQLLLAIFCLGCSRSSERPSMVEEGEFRNGEIENLVGQKGLIPTSHSVDDENDQVSPPEMTTLDAAKWHFSRLGRGDRFPVAFYDGWGVEYVDDIEVESMYW